MSSTMATSLTIPLCDTISNATAITPTTSYLDLLDYSSDLVKIRPVYLETTHIQQLAPRWRSCNCCYEPLQKQTIQMACCDTMFHRQCLQDFSKQKALVRDEYGDPPDTTFCPWCNVTLNCRPADMWTALQEDTVGTVLKIGKELDIWLTELSKLDGIARIKFMRLAFDYNDISGALVRAVRLPAKVAAVRRLCHGYPEALRAFDLLYKERQSSFSALLEWMQWLIFDDIEDLEDETNLINAETMYGRGPNRFAPRIVERLRKEE